MSVDDSRGVQAGFDNGNTSGDDYLYDANGNPTRDRNKGIESIEYNLLNLPTKITFNDNHYLTYLYDAAGIKLQQKEYRSDTLYKTTDYTSSSIYVTMGQGEPVLQELMHDEGRIIPVTLSDSEGAVEGYDYQYRLSDHLGNTRVIYSTNLEQYTMVEDFENGAVNGFTDLHVTTDENANTTLPLGENNKTALLKSGETGALVFLHLNKGDTIDLQVNASYTDTPSDNTFASTAFSALFGTFNGTISGGEAPSALANEFNDALSSAAMAGKAEDTEAPRAYLNYIFFDDDMNYVTAGFEPITEAAYRVNAGEHEIVRLDDIIADQEGYLLAYLSNENQEQVNVYFDDFTVHQSKTNLVFASDYYPYGMPFNQYYRTASIGSRYQYQGKEYLEEEGLNLYDFHARYYDPALGRFTTVDPKADSFSSMSPYLGMGANPIIIVDPDGEFIHIVIGAVVGGVINLGIKAYQGKINSLTDGLVAFGIGAAAGGIGAATGGAAFLAAGGGAAGAGGFAAGFIGGVVGSAASMPIQSAGNSLYFGDPFITGEDYLKGILIGGVIGGAINGISASANGRGFWDGLPKNQGSTPIGPVIQPKGIESPKPAEIQAPSALSKVNTNSPSKLTSAPSSIDPLNANGTRIGGGDLAGKTIYLDDVTVNGSRLNQFWNKSTIFNNVKVFQRDGLINPKLVDAMGRTNLQRMQKGIAPIGSDGKSINLHHMTQRNTSSIVEVTKTFHQANHSILHINPNTIPSGIDRAAFNAWKRLYWMNRALDF